MRWRKPRRIWVLLMLSGLVVTGSAACSRVPETNAPRVDGNRVAITVAGGTAEIDTASLAVSARTGGQRVELSGPVTGLGTAGGVRTDGESAQWTYPDRGWTVTAGGQDGRLRVTVHSARPGRLIWPVTGGDPAARSLQIPRGEGLSLPVRDPFWNGPDAGLVDSSLTLTSGLTMPFWGYRLDGRGVSYLVPTDIGSTLTVRSVDGRLTAAAAHDFDDRGDTGDYTVTFALTDDSPVVAARDYRDWLLRHGEFRSLRAKIARNPEVARLLGAFHAYVWGEARTPEAVERLRQLGITRMWLGYDSDESPMSAAAVAAAKNAGYLAGPYDSWANAQDPATADNPGSRWPGSTWPDGCVRAADGTPETGFGGRGCYLSSQALYQDPDLYRDRYAQVTGNGANTYFLDVDAAGEFFDDHSVDHPMTARRDRDNRLARLRWLAEDRGQVLGSESAGAWAAPVLDFDHGAQTPVSDRLWAFQRDRTVWGGYAPANAPRTYFQPVVLPDQLARAMFDPVYRVPLYETVLHDSIVNTDRWELSYDKLPQQQTMRALTAILNNTPLNFVLDGDTLAERGPDIARLQRFFAPLHEAAGTLPMTDFRWLTDDHLVQRTVFGDGTLTVTANFGTAEHDGLPGGCVDAALTGDTTARRLCPAA
ncbi:MULTISPECIES: glycoside hydrolase [unclassified Nocardia]|uniref:glycoside hydrolase n=1 Tax=unclassified Nocardia TaxID=2637762 RepID=UPI00278C1636|nr:MULTISPECIES: glycoside hydrolase [unclassified Nocardia]